MANMFSGFIARPQALGDSIYQGLGALASQQQAQQQAQATRNSEVEAAELLNQSLRTAKSDPAQSEQLFIQAMQKAPDFVQKVTAGLGARREVAGEQYASASQREFESMISGLPEEDQEKARRIRLGLTPRAVGSSAMTIADTGATESVATSEAEIAGAKSEASEAGKGRGMASTSDIVGKAKSEISKAVKKAEIEGKALGEAQVSYNQARASLPAVEEVVGRLRELAPIATSTFGGRAFNAAAKELGFGATEGAEARASFTAIVDNQVLPLLKQTFGAAFTVQEMEALKATLGDVNASPGEKMAQLDAFIEAKYRDLELRSKEAGTPANTTGGAPASAIDYLRSNPELIGQFEAKYGYRPEGF